MEPRIRVRGLCISGKMLSGKDTFAQSFKKLSRKKSITNIAFADKLKIYCKYLLVNLSQDLAHKRTHEETVYKLSQYLNHDLFQDEENVSNIYTRLMPLTRADYIQCLIKTPMQMPGVLDPCGIPYQEFGFENIDAFLWGENPKPRKLTQEFGTAFVRSIRDSAWIDHVRRIINTHHDQFFIVTDARYPNEVMACRAEGLLDISVSAPLDLRIRRSIARDGTDGKEAMSHSSETSLDDFRFSVSVDNSTSIMDLETRIKSTPELTALL